MFKDITDMFNWLNNAGVFAFLMVLIPAVYKLVKPLLTRKVQTEKNTHVKQGLEVGLNLANTIVPEMAVMAGLSLSDRKKEAIRFVNAQLTANGFNLDIQTISGLVEKAYQAYKVAGGDNHAPVVAPAPTEVMTPSEGTDSND
ncbi:hypothetical protein RIN67_12845 (plasmid) [Levilactobacillus namurensis]|uniref:hypothetical protein n=1 Tax=Levilactobacillus namurensis TaxID=380393 RepID=UPI0028BED679|nr:hypothetical protein [Levilactobacillus namurensis]WNN66808.1 hypothetical protein RIN67_12845 [Levilactobacillus namurensis]